MMTYNITVDLDNPSTKKLEVPANIPYAIRLNLMKGGLAHAAWDGQYGVGNVIPTALDYEARFSNGKWLNSGDAWKTGFFNEEEGAVEVDAENANLVVLNCAGRDAGSDGVRLLVNPTATNWETIPEAEAIGEGDADPRAASRIDIVCSYVEKEGCKPAASGIPTKLSELENDVGFITEDDIPTNYVKTDEINNLGDEPLVLGTNAGLVILKPATGESLTVGAEGFATESMEIKTPSDESGEKTLATREWVGDQTITMSGTYDDDTEFSFSIKGSN